MSNKQGRTFWDFASENPPWVWAMTRQEIERSDEIPEWCPLEKEKQGG